MIRLCWICKEEKPLTEFIVDAPIFIGLLSCKDCRRKKKFQVKSRIRNKLLELSGKICHICLEQTEKDKLHLDHCHRTMKIRGALCRACNSGLGLMCDDETLIESLIDYLNRTKELDLFPEWHTNKTTFNVFKLTPIQNMKIQTLKPERCNCCKEKTYLCPDHCHASGRVRGFLCRNCNTALGNFQEDEEIMRSAIDYLQGNPHATWINHG